jgi:hypothetical protein
MPTFRIRILGPGRRVNFSEHHDYPTFLEAEFRGEQVRVPSVRRLLIPYPPS